MKKELELSLKFDFGDFDRKVNEMQKKLQTLTASSDQTITRQRTSERLQQAGYGGLAGGPTGADTAQAFANKQRLIDKSIKDEKSSLEDKIRKTNDLEKTHSKLLRQSQEDMAAKKETLKLVEKIKEVEEDIRKARDEGVDSEVKLNALLKEQEKLRGGGAGGGGAGGPSGRKGPGGGADDFLKIANLMKYVGMAQIPARMYDAYTNLALTTSLASGSATQNVLGRPLQDISAGNVVTTGAFLSERQRAMQMAKDKMEAQEKTDMFTSPTQVTGNLLGGAATAVRNVGSLKLLQVMGIDKVLDNMSQEFTNAQAASRLQKFGENYQADYEAEKSKNPLKVLAANRLQERYMADLQTQRMMGLNNAAFSGRGGFQERANLAGFTGDLGIQMAQQLQAAGGSTRGMVGNSLLALQAQKGFDLTNAGAVLGRISGGAGGAKESEQVFKKILTESMKDGLDKSEFREEQRRFADITSDILSQSGVKTGTDAERLLQGFSRFLGGEPTIKELEGARSAYKEQQAFSAETGGRGGALQFAAIMKQPHLSKLGPMAIGSMMEIPEADLTSTNPFIVAKAQQAGVSPEQLIKEITSAKREKSLVEVGLDPGRVKALDVYMRKNKLDESTITREQLDRMQKEAPDVWSTYQDIQSAPGVKSGYESIQKRTDVARGLRTATREYKAGELPEGWHAGMLTPDQVAQQGLERKDTGRIEDQTVSAAGAAAQAMLKNFRDFEKEITPASNALNKFTQQAILLATVMNSVGDRDAAATLKGAINALHDQNLPQVQPQAGSPDHK